MKSRDFAFWLQGFFELGGGTDGLSAQQVAVIKQHLGLVFQHDPDIAAKPHLAVPSESKSFQQLLQPGRLGGTPAPTMIC